MRYANTILLGTLAFNLLLDHFFLVEGLPFVNGLKALSLLLLLFFAGIGKESKRLGDGSLFVFIIYLSLFLLGVCLLPFSESPESSIYSIIVYLTKVLMFFGCVSICLSKKWFDTEPLIKIWVVLGMIFASQAIAHAVFLYFLRTEPTYYAVYLPRLKETRYISWCGQGFPGSFTRPSSFFTEANDLAQFLFAPMFLSLASGSKWRYLVSAVILLGLVSCMSFAATFAVIIGLILYSLTQIRIPFLRPVLMLGGIIAISFSAW